MRRRVGATRFPKPALLFIAAEGGSPTSGRTNRAVGWEVTSFYFSVQRRSSGTHSGSTSMTDQTPFMDQRHLLPTSFYGVDLTSSTALAANWDASFIERGQRSKYKTGASSGNIDRFRSPFGEWEAVGEEQNADIQTTKIIKHQRIARWKNFYSMRKKPTKRKKLRVMELP